MTCLDPNCHFVIPSALGAVVAAAAGRAGRPLTAELAERLRITSRTHDSFWSRLMAVIPMSPAMARAIEWSVGQVTHSLAEQSDTTGAQAERVLGPPQWTASIRSEEAMTLIEGGLWQSVLLKLRGGANVLELWDPVRVRAQGTLRGPVALAGAAAKGAASATLSGCPAGRTLLPGDWLQIGSGFGTSQLVSVVEPATANSAGQMVVVFEAPLRQAFAAGVTVATEKCLGYYRMQGNMQAKYRAGEHQSGGFAADFVEAWR